LGVLSENENFGWLMPYGYKLNKNDPQPTSCAFSIERRVVSSSLLFKFLAESELPYLSSTTAFRFSSVNFLAFDIYSTVRSVLPVRGDAILLSLIVSLIPTEVQLFVLNIPYLPVPLVTSHFLAQ
jgi:hypothetical protein